MSYTCPSIDFLKLEWWNKCDIGNILYQTDFCQRMFLKADAGLPEYSYQETVTPDGNDDNIPVFQKWTKKYKIKILVSEYQLDALTAIPLHDNIWITLQNGERAKIKTISISEPEWDKCGCFANITIEFTINSINKACCENHVLYDEPAPGVDVLKIYFHADTVAGGAAGFKIRGTLGKKINIDWRDGEPVTVHVLTALDSIVEHWYKPSALQDYQAWITGDINEVTRITTVN